jgi:ubiquinone biosynthesis protein Coq4
MTRNRFAFPGEPDGVAEAHVIHDLVHVVSGYGTHPEGELLMAAFTAGCRREDPFVALFAATVQLHAGVQLSSEAGAKPAAKFNLDPARLVAAVQCGAKCTVDFFDAWDWWAVVDVPLAELRKRYGIDA